ncbi:hypothetical protein GGX14DRAFT_613578 [Mycena pura]|uniref:Uncharacterized protein n=1 Tax=Mycena pura TaxID=153505 RepID=A0AAD6YT85_9AGAR|nr:hypothetical protein GGX14DRAFT_613578 [Mycena pura]
MRFVVSAVAVASLIPGIYGLTVNSPTASSLVACQPIALAWSNGTAPYYLSVIPGNNPSGAALKTFAATADTSLTWIVDVAANTSITLALKDSTGATAYSAATTIQSGADNSCATISASAVVAGPTAVMNGTAGATDANTAPTVVMATTTTHATLVTANIPSASRKPASNAAPAVLVNYSLAGLLGLLGIFLL